MRRPHPKPVIAVILFELAALCLLLTGLIPRAAPVIYHLENQILPALKGTPSDGEKTETSYIKWVDFQVTSEAMQQAFRYDVDTFQSDIHLNWIELLACLGARYGGDFSKYKASHMTQLADRLLAGETMETITADMKYYPYYLEAYDAVLGGMVGLYDIEIPASEAPPAKQSAVPPQGTAVTNQGSGKRKILLPKLPRIRKKSGSPNMGSKPSRPLPAIILIKIMMILVLPEVTVTNDSIWGMI